MGFPHEQTFPELAHLYACWPVPGILVTVFSDFAGTFSARVRRVKRPAVVDFKWVHGIISRDDLVLETVRDNIDCPLMAGYVIQQLAAKYGAPHGEP
jgi:hypothetical protein